MAPVTGVALVRGSDLGARTRPEPAVDVLGLEIGSVAAVEVALAAGGPDESHVSCAKLFNSLVKCNICGDRGFSNVRKLVRRKIVWIMV